MGGMSVAKSLKASLLRACDDRRLFGFDLWPRQRELLDTVEGSRINAWCVGRRSGKSTLAAVTCLWDVLLRPELDAMVRPGETRFAVAVATNVSQGRLIVQAARSVIEHSPALSGLLAGQTEDELRFTLPGGARTAIRAFPCSSRGGRGWPISTLVMDEAAHFLTEQDGDRAAERVWEALVPSTAQFGAAARVIVSSTPYGMNGLFYDTWMRAQKGEIAGAVAQHATTAQVNPTISAEFLAAEEARDPESFRAEYLAEFTSSGDSFLDFDRIDTTGAPTAGPKDARGWVAGLDPAFSKDPFAVALVGRAEDGRLLCGPVKAFQAAGEFAGPVDDVAALAKEYQAGCVIDQFCSAPTADRLRNAHGLQVKVHTMSATTKTAIFQELKARLYDGSLLLPDNPGLVAELRRLRTKYAAGQAAVLTPRVGNSHCDMAQALALAVYEMPGATAHVGSFLAGPSRPSPTEVMRPGLAFGEDRPPSHQRRGGKLWRIP